MGINMKVKTGIGPMTEDERYGGACNQFGRVFWNKIKIIKSLLRRIIPPNLVQNHMLVDKNRHGTDE